MRRFIIMYFIIFAQELNKYRAALTNVILRLDEYRMYLSNSPEALFKCTEHRQPT